MIELYVALIKAGKRSIDQVPDQHQVEVKAKLNA